MFYIVYFNITIHMIVFKLSQHFYFTTSNLELLGLFIEFTNFVRMFITTM